LLTLDNEKIEKELNFILSNNPHLLYNKIEPSIREANYHMIIHSVLQVLGFNIKSEVPTSKGYIDAVIEIEDMIVIIEFKHMKKSSYDYMIKEAFKSIIEKGYYKKYMDKKVVLLAVAIKERECKCKFKTLEQIKE